MKAEELIVGGLYRSTKGVNRVVRAVSLNYRDPDCFAGKIVEDRTLKAGYTSNMFYLSKFELIEEPVSKKTTLPILSKSSLSQKTVMQSAMLVVLSDIFDNSSPTENYLMKFIKTKIFEEAVREKIKLLNSL